MKTIPFAIACAAGILGFFLSISEPEPNVSKGIVKLPIIGISQAHAGRRYDRASQKNHASCEAWCAARDECKKCSTNRACGFGFRGMNTWGGFGRNWTACENIRIRDFHWTWSTKVPTDRTGYFCDLVHGCTQVRARTKAGANLALIGQSVIGTSHPGGIREGRCGPPPGENKPVGNYKRIIQHGVSCR